MSYSFADVVLVPFPFTNQSTLKKRPAVVVSSDAYQRSHMDLIVAAITSQAAADRFGEVALVNWHDAGLLKPSVIKPALATLEQGLVIKKLGRLSSGDRSQLRATLEVVLGR